MMHFFKKLCCCNEEPLSGSTCIDSYQSDPPLPPTSENITLEDDISSFDSISDSEYLNDTKYDWYDVNKNDNRFNDGIVSQQLKIITTLEEKLLGVYNGDEKDDFYDKEVYLASIKRNYENVIASCNEDDRKAVISAYEYKKDHYMNHLDDKYKVEREELLDKGRRMSELCDKKKYYVDALKMAYSTLTIKNIKKEWIILASFSSK